MPTLLGKASFASSIPAEFAYLIFKDLAESRSHLVLESDIHLLYLITPHFKNLKEPNWEIFIKRFQKLTRAEQGIATFYGLDVEYLYRSAIHKPRLPIFLKDHYPTTHNPQLDSKASQKTDDQSLADISQME